MLDKIITYRDFNEAETLEVARLIGHAVTKSYLKNLASETLVEIASLPMLGVPNDEIVKSHLKAQGRLEVLNTLLSIDDTKQE